MSAPAAANSGSAASAACIAIVVATPSISQRASAPRSRASASARSRPLTISLASSDGVDPALDRVPGQPHVVLAQAQRAALGHGDLLGDQVEPADGLGDRMLNLDPRVHLQEVEGAARGVDEELDGAEPAAGQVPPERDRGAADLGPQALVEERRGRLLEDLLVPPLHRAVPVAQVDDALTVAEQLHLDVTAGRHLPLQVHPAVPERRAGFGDRALDRRVELPGLFRRAQAPSAAATHRLDQDRPADLAGQPRRLGGAADRPSGNHRQAGGDRVAARPELVADGFELRGRRADEDQASRVARPRQPRALGEESVAGVHRLGASGERRPHHGAGIQVARRRSGGPDPDRGVGQPGRHRVPVGVGDREDGLDAERPAGAQDPHGDLPPVRDEDPPQDHGSSLSHISPP